jgi:hypothetical protein
MKEKPLTFPKEDVVYIDNDPNKGIKVDWELLRKYYKKLVKVQNIYNPCKIPFEHIRYCILMSTRKTGKTNTLLTMGLLSAWVYGTMIAYVRQTEEMIDYRNIKSFFDVQLSNNYVSIITGGEYSGIQIKGDYASFVHYDDKMKVDKRSAPIMVFLSISKQASYKSSLNLPRCNMVLFDEFVGSYGYNEYVEFNQLLSTIIRDKTEVMICMLANSISLYNPYLKELTIAKDVKNLKQNESALIKTRKGTSLYIELIGDASPERQELNTLYFGFDNPKLSAITGGDWAVAEYPHIEREDRSIITKSIYLIYSEQIVQFELVNNDRMGIHILAHAASKISEKSLLIFTISDIVDMRYKFAFGSGKFCKTFWRLYDDHKIFYSDNEVGDIVEQYVNTASKL